MRRYLSCDWGSSSFRLCLRDPSTDTFGPGVQADKGCSDLAGSAPGDQPRAQTFADFLHRQLAPLGAEAASPDIPVVLSGMVTSAHGWLNLPYARTPVSLRGGGLLVSRERQSDGRLLVFVSGIRTEDDVMRGEECQLAGLLGWMESEAGPPQAPLRVILPGTHCKHVRIRNECLVDFRTFMTGELYAVLGEHSVLSHSLPPGQADPEPPDPAALAAGVRYVMLHGLAAALFNVRVGMLLRHEKPHISESFLNGILVGAEFDPRAMDDNGETIVLCAAGRLQAVYAAVLDVLGFGERITVVPGDMVRRLAILGHGEVLEALEDSTGVD